MTYKVCCTKTKRSNRHFSNLTSCSVCICLDVTLALVRNFAFLFRGSMSGNKVYIISSRRRGAHLIMSSTRKIISAASEALSKTCNLLL